jgi:hypothetical protein
MRFPFTCGDMVKALNSGKAPQALDQCPSILEQVHILNQHAVRSILVGPEIFKVDEKLMG